MRYDQFGNYHVNPMDRMAHDFNSSVPGLLGYRTQSGSGDKFRGREQIDIYDYTPYTDPAIPGAPAYNPYNPAPQPPWLNHEYS